MKNQWGFHNKEYWDNRYLERPEIFDWYQPFSNFGSRIKEFIKPGKKALNVGCGCSTMSYDLLSHGFKLIENIDFSENCITIMKDKYRNEKRLVWRCMDCMNIGFNNSTFDYVFDKATLDAIMCAPNGYRAATRMISEIRRVLKKGGYFFEISYGGAEQRRCILETDGFKYICEREIVKKDNSVEDIHYVHILQKQ